MQNLYLLVVISSRYKSEEILNRISEKPNLLLYGKGTAPSEIKEILGVYDAEKDVALTLISNIEEIKEKIEKDDLLKRNGAIAFTIPLTSLVSEKLVEMIKEQK